MTFFERRGECVADIDIDDAGGLGHVFQVMRNHLTRAPTHPFDEPVPARPVDLREGPVMVTIEYQIDPGRSDEFDQVMADTRSARLRAGAVSWGLYEDLQRPGRWVEYFACNTWADYLRRFDRFTAADERLQQRRHALHIAEGPPRISRFVARHPPG